MMSETVEVDRQYLWALETVAVGETRQDSIGTDTEPVSQSDYITALNVLKQANLHQPRQLHGNDEQ